MEDKQKKKLAKLFLVPGFILVAPGVLYVLYKMLQAFVAAVMLTLQKGEVGPICFMFGLAGFFLLLIGGCIWAEAVGDDCDMGWY